MRRFSIEAYSRASSDEIRDKIAAVGDTPPTYNEKDSEPRGHRRHSSITSQLSNFSFTSSNSDGSLATRKSSTFSDSDALVYIPEESVPGASDALPRKSGVEQSPFKSIKSAFRRSFQGPPKDYITIKRTGSLDQSDLTKVVEKHRKASSGIVTFRMSEDSFVGYGQLSTTLNCLGDALPSLEHITLYSQVYTLEELNSITTPLSRFPNLRTLQIMDAMDDPPEVCPSLVQILAVWGTQCPSLRRIQFKNGAWWQPEVPEKEVVGATRGWEEHDLSSDGPSGKAVM